MVILLKGVRKMKSHVFKWEGRVLLLSVGEYDRDFGEDASFYTCISDEDDMCWQYNGDTLDHVEMVMLELISIELLGGCIFENYQKICELYGLYWDL